MIKDDNKELYTMLVKDAIDRRYPIFDDAGRMIIKNAKGNTRMSKLLNYLKDTYKGTELIVSEDKKILFVSKSAKEYSYPAKRITKKEREIKENISIDLQQVLKTAKFIDNVDYKGSNKSYEHYLVYFIIKKGTKEDAYEATLNIKKEADGRWIFYDITKIKNIGNSRQINATPDVSNVI